MFTVRVEGLEELRKEYAKVPKEMNRALGLAINEAASHGRSEASSTIRKEYNIKKRDLDKAIRITQKGKASSLMAVIQIASHPMSLIEFNPHQYQKQRGYVFKTTGRNWREMKRMPKTKTGVFVAIKHGPAKNIKPAFIGYNKFGEPRVYLRDKVGKRIAPMFVNTIPTFMTRQGRMDRLRASIGDYLHRRAIHHLGRIGL